MVQVRTFEDAPGTNFAAAASPDSSTCTPGRRRRRSAFAPTAPQRMPGPYSRAPIGRLQGPSSVPARRLAGRQQPRTDRPHPVAHRPPGLRYPHQQPGQLRRRRIEHGWARALVHPDTLPRREPAAAPPRPGRGGASVTHHDNPRRTLWSPVVRTNRPVLYCAARNIPGDGTACRGSGPAGREERRAGDG